MKRMTEDPQIGRLLSGTERASPLERAEIFDDVFRKTVGRERLVRRALIGSAAVLTVVLGALIMPPKEDRDRFTAKGGQVASFALRCADAQGQRCPCEPGSTLLFQLEPAGASHLGLFAKGPKSQLIWFFPKSPQETSLALAGHLQAGILDRAVQLGEEHPSGTYEVVGVFTREPASRAELMALAARGGPQVVTRSLRIP